MNVEIAITLDVEEQDSSGDAIQAAQNQLRSMEIEDIIDLACYHVELNP